MCYTNQTRKEIRNKIYEYDNIHIESNFRQVFGPTACWDALSHSCCLTAKTVLLTQCMGTRWHQNLSWNKCKPKTHLAVKRGYFCLSSSLIPIPMIIHRTNADSYAKRYNTQIHLADLFVLEHQLVPFWPPKTRSYPKSQSNTLGCALKVYCSQGDGASKGLVQKHVRSFGVPGLRGELRQPRIGQTPSK